MKNIIKSLSYTALAGVVGLLLSLSANAQHRDGGGNSSPAPQRSAPQSAPARSFTPRASAPAPQRSSTYTGQRNYNNNRQTTTQRSTSGITQTRQYNGATRSAVQTYRPAAGSTQGSYYGHNHSGGF